MGVDLIPRETETLEASSSFSYLFTMRAKALVCSDVSLQIRGRRLLLVSFAFAS